MKELWYLQSGCLPAHVCDKIIALGLSLPEKVSTVVASDGTTAPNENIRRTSVRWIYSDTLGTADLWKFIDRQFTQANDEFFHVDVSHIASLQFTTYKGNTQDYYNWHKDVVWKTAKSHQRKLSMSIQLSDPATYTDCDLQFDCSPAPDQNALRQRGSIVIFPSFVPHRVTPITKGVRHSLVTWLEGPC